MGRCEGSRPRGASRTVCQSVGIRYQYGAGRWQLACVGEWVAACNHSPVNLAARRVSSSLHALADTLRVRHAPHVGCRHAGRLLLQPRAPEDEPREADLTNRVGHAAQMRYECCVHTEDEPAVLATACAHLLTRMCSLGNCSCGAQVEWAARGAAHSSMSHMATHSVVTNGRNALYARAWLLRVRFVAVPLRAVAAGCKRLLGARPTVGDEGASGSGLARVIQCHTVTSGWLSSALHVASMSSESLSIMKK